MHFSLHVQPCTLCRWLLDSLILGTDHKNPMLLFETFPEASLFARHLAKRSAKVVRLWPDARGWLVENLAAERKSHAAGFFEEEDYGHADPLAEEIEYQERQRLMDDPKFPNDEAYSLGGDLNEDWMLDHG